MLKNRAQDDIWDCLLYNRAAANLDSFRLYKLGKQDLDMLVRLVVPCEIHGATAQAGLHDAVLVGIS